MLKEIKIHKYRGFKDVSFKLGTQLTVGSGDGSLIRFAIKCETRN